VVVVVIPVVAVVDKVVGGISAGAEPLSSSLVAVRILRSTALQLGKEQILFVR
jgi:hypothetical protein